jgi:hypothetical protein
MRSRSSRSYDADNLARLRPELTQLQPTGTARNGVVETRTLTTSGG